MARTSKAKPAAPAPAPEETDEGGAVRGPGEMHELFSEFLKEEYGVTVSPEAIFHVTSKRTAFRKSDAYLEYAEGLDEQRAEAAKAKAEKKAAREAAAEEEPEEEEKPARRRGKAKAADAEEAPAEEKVTPIRGRRRGKAVEPVGDEAQAEAPKPAATRRRRSAAPANF
jgi:hypothetical protein